MRIQEIKQQPGAKMRATADHVHRSFAGPIGCIFTIAILLISTPLYREHPLASALFMGAMLVRIAPRVVLSLVRRHSGTPAEYPFWMLAASAGLLSIPTGLFAGFVIRLYGFENWSTLFIVVFALSCAISGAGVIAPHLELNLAFQTTLLLPMIVACFQTGGEHSMVAGLCFLLFSVYVTLHSIRLNGDYWNSLATDLELKERAEELHAAKLAAEAANEAKSRFLANMSHEIRTPMHGVLGMLELALDTSLSEQQREYLGYARQSAESLLGLLNDLLDHSKAESGKLSLEQIDFQLRQVLADAFAPFVVQARAKGIDLDWTADGAVPDDLRGDPTRLRQILVNLVSNAIKFTPSGAIRMSVEVDDAAADHTILHFRVADTGPGIPPDRREDIFDAFSQGDTSITRRFGGTGLGLAICRDLVSLMGGRIWVESASGSGSSFHFTARFTAALRHAQTETAAASENAAAAGRPLRILIAEDNFINQKLLAGLLAKFGHGFEVAGDGERALSLLGADRFDLVLMDVQMPGLDGLEVTRRIREAEALSGRHTPIVGVTAGASAAELQACIAAGMDSCLSKPIVIADLKRVLDRLSNGHH